MRNIYDSLSLAINDLKKKGYNHDFNLEKDRICCDDSGKSYAPTQFYIHDVFRFEGMTNPGDSSILYAIETEKGDKGLLVDGYGAYSEEISPEMIDKLKRES